MALTTIDPIEVERFVSSVWSMTLALSPGARACGEVLRGMSGFLSKFADTLDRGSPEQLCVKSHNAVIRQLISMSVTASGIPVADLRHVGKSILEYICIDLLFDDGEYSDEEEEPPPRSPFPTQGGPPRGIFPLHPGFSQGLPSIPEATTSTAPTPSSPSPPTANAAQEGEEDEEGNGNAEESNED